MILRLHHAQLTVPRRSEAEARRFYCGFLELPEADKPESLVGRGGFWLRVGDRQVHVGIEDGVDRSASKAHLAYQVTNLAYWRERLQEVRIETLPGEPIPGYERLEFRDPFGNRVELIQRRPGAPPAEIEEQARLVEELAANAWPAAVQQHVDGWRLRFHGNVTRRSNSVLALDDGGRIPLDEKLALAEDFYRRRGLPPRFQINPFSQPAALDALLEERGYVVTDRTCVQTASASDIPLTLEEGTPEVQARTEALSEWLTAYQLAAGLTRDQAAMRRTITERIGSETAYFWADFPGSPTERGQVPPGVALGVLERDWLGIFCMCTREEQRRLGIARSILQGMAEWARVRGVSGLYLQVSEENAAARALYESMGFQTLYLYWYRELPH